MASSVSSGRRAKYPEGGLFAGISAGCDEHPVQFGDEQRGPRSGNGRDVSRAAIFAASCLDDIQVPVSTADVESVTLGVDEKIVRITARIHGCNRAAVPGGDDGKLRGISRHH